MAKVPVYALVEVNRNFLRVLSSLGEISEVELTRDVAQDSRIKDIPEFSKILKNALSSFKSKAHQLVFLIEEKDIYDRFFVLRNDEENIDLSLRTQAASYVGKTLDELQVVFQKVSPFVFQFVGIDKSLLDIYKQISSSVGVKLYSVVPMSFVFSRMVDKFDPFFFVYKGPEESTLVASEYGGVYYSGTYSTTSDINKKLASLISELAPFNRKDPVKEVYVFGEGLELDSSFKQNQLSKEMLGSDIVTGFERLHIADYVVKKNSDFIDSYFNLNFKTNSQVVSENKDRFPKYVLISLIVSALFLTGYILYSADAFSFLFKKQVETTKDAEELAPALPVDTQPQETTPSANINKAEVKIRIENGSGTAGVAAKAQEFLKGKGYTVVEIGNALRSDYAQTEIQVKSDKKALAEAVKADMTGTYTSVVQGEVSADKTYDILVIIGKQ